MNCAFQNERKENKFYQISCNLVLVEKASSKNKVIVNLTASSNIIAIELHGRDLEQLNEARGSKGMKLVKKGESRPNFPPSWSLENP